MHPVLLGPIKSFGFMLAISFVVGIWLAARRGAARGLSREMIYDLSFIVMLSSIIGVRLFFVVTHLDEFSGRWLRVFAFTDGGLTLYGGLLAAILASWIFCRRRRLSFMMIADVMIPSVALGIGITRIGCFLAGCCYGLPCELPWAIRFPELADATRHFGAVAVHPSQLYASVAGFVIAALLLWWERRSRRPGETLARFLLLYGAARFGLDFMRYYEPAQRWVLDWTNNQWISLVLVVVGLVVLVRAARKGERPA